MANAAMAAPMTPTAARSSVERGQAEIRGHVVEGERVEGGEPTLPGHHRENDDGEEGGAALESRHGPGCEIVDDVDDDVLVAQEDRRERHEEGVGEQELDELVDAPDRRVEGRTQS